MIAVDDVDLAGDPRFQSLIWHGEQVFFPTEGVHGIIEFFHFFAKWQELEDGKIRAREIIESFRGQGSPIIDYFLSTTSDSESESEAEFEQRHRQAVVKASDYGYPSAAYSRYIYCHDGSYGFEEDKVEALRWLRRAAELGHFRAMHLFGLYLLSKGDDMELGEKYVAVAKFYLIE